MREGCVFAGNLDALKDAGRIVVRGRHRPILVVSDRARVFALDNRCPHMGFPLDKGTVDDGILTCHWHHARFDLASGCTFDLWADDIPTCPVEVRDGKIWVKPIFGEADAHGHWRQRLEDGMAHDLGLVIAKSIHGLISASVPPVEIVRQAVLFGARNRDSWDTGLTVLTALANLLPSLPEVETQLALFHGIRRVAADCDGQPPRRARSPLTSQSDLETLKRWLRRWTAVRHREAVERTLLTVIASGASPAAVAELLFAAETDRVFADGGHSLDFINKAFECLEIVGWECASAILPSVISQMVAARGTEESTAWRQPVDLVALLSETFSELPAQFSARHDGQPWRNHAALAHALLSDDPKAIVGALKESIGAGASPVDLGRALGYAAALRVARFGTANEHADWETAHHAFTYCNAVHQVLKRIGGATIGQSGYIEAVRGVFHGAMAVYLARYLNVPPQRLPGDDGDRLDDLPADGDVIRSALLTALDRQQQVDTAARLVARYLLCGHEPELLIGTLSHALLREDAGFHAYQMLEAGVRQFREWGNGNEGRHILIAVVRYLAAHSPTERSTFQTADIAQRLMRGGQLHETAEPDA
jgi:nitrite reductase/ring-hydroxylating ferredoxin subunit